MDFITVGYDKSVDRASFDCDLHGALNTYIAQHAGQDEKAPYVTNIHVRRGWGSIGLLHLCERCGDPR